MCLCAVLYLLGAHVYYVLEVLCWIVYFLSPFYLFFYFEPGVFLAVVFLAVLVLVVVAGVAGVVVFIGVGGDVGGGFVTVCLSDRYYRGGLWRSMWMFIWIHRGYIGMVSGSAWGYVSSVCLFPVCLAGYLLYVGRQVDIR
ncbi:hypothetical protein F4861DRAFT_491993 [Xylaria intraflava]|nr:hypothetical protein F4861DRAFT_491993 [Xylaria intraflava]